MSPFSIYGYDLKKKRITCFFLSSHCHPLTPGPMKKAICENLGQVFKKWGWLDRTSTFRGGLLGKRGVTFFRGVAIFT